LTGANTQNTFLSFIPFEGLYPDLTFQWYNDIGSSLVITMLTAAFSPFIDFGVSFSQKIVFRCLDKGFKIKTENTKTKTIQ
jgi:hypothetical protein